MNINYIFLKKDCQKVVTLKYLLYIVKAMMQQQLKLTIMTNQEAFTIAAQTAGFEFFSNCIKNGATPAQAQKEMMSKEGQKTISKRIQEILA